MTKLVDGYDTSGPLVSHADPATWARFRALLASLDELGRDVVTDMVRRLVPLAQIVAAMEKRLHK